MVHTFLPGYGFAGALDRAVVLGVLVEAAAYLDDADVAPREVAGLFDSFVRDAGY